MLLEKTLVRKALTTLLFYCVYQPLCMDASHLMQLEREIWIHDTVYMMFQARASRYTVAATYICTLHYESP